MVTNQSSSYLTPLYLALCLLSFLTSFSTDIPKVDPSNFPPASLATPCQFSLWALLSSPSEMLLFLGCVTKPASHPIHPLLVILSTLMDPIIILKVLGCLSLAQSPFLSLLPKYLSAGYFILGISQRNSTHVSSKPAPLPHIPYSVMNTTNHLEKISEK